MVLGLLGGIFDPSIKYLYDSSKGLDVIGDWQIINQSNASLSVSKTSDKQLVFKNTSDVTSYCYGCFRNKTPIDVRGYSYLYIHCVKSYFYTTEYDAAQHANKIRLYKNPDLSNDGYTNNSALSAEEAGFFNGTFVSGTAKSYLGTVENFTIEMNISSLNSSDNFRMIGTIGPSNSYMQIDKIYLSRYKL